MCAAFSTVYIGITRPFLSFSPNSSFFVWGRERAWHIQDEHSSTELHPSLAAVLPVISARLPLLGFKNVPR